MEKSAVAVASAEVRTSAVGDKIVGAILAASVLDAWIDFDFQSPLAGSDIRTDPASTVRSTPLCLYALMHFHTWQDLRHPQGSGRPGYQVRCPPTSRIPLAIWRIRLDVLFRNSPRIPMSAHIADPIFCAN